MEGYKEIRSNLNNNGSVRRPADEPQSHVGHGHLRNANFGRLGVGLGVGPEVGDVHLLGLLPHCRLVSNDGLHDEHVGEHDDGERDAIVEDKDGDAKGAKVPVAGEVIKGAGVQDACNKKLSSGPPGLYIPFRDDFLRLCYLEFN